MIAASLAAHVLWPMPALCEQTDLSANAIMPGCRLVIEKGPGRFLAATPQAAYDGGRCAGFVTGIAIVDPGNCAPAGSTIDQLMRVVLKYVDERPQLMHEAFAILVQQALATAWPCKR